MGIAGRKPKNKGFGEEEREAWFYGYPLTQYLPKIHDESHLHEWRDIYKSQNETLGPNQNLNPHKCNPKRQRTKQDSEDSSNREDSDKDLNRCDMNDMDICRHLKTQGVL